MASTTHYVNPGADAGGDGTTSALTGANCAFQSLNAAEAALSDGDPYEAGDTATINCSGTTADTTAVTFAGWDTDVSIIVVGDYAVSSGAHWSNSYYHLTTATNAINCQVANINFSKLQISVSTTYDVGITYDTALTYSSNIDRVIIYSSTQAGSQAGIFCGTNITDATLNITNCVIYNFIFSANEHGIYIRKGTANIKNCTVYGCYSGIRQRDTGVVNITNTTSYSNTDDFSGTVSADYCATDDDADRGTNGVDLNENASSEWTNAFVSYATYNFHLQSGGLLTNAGTDLYGSGVTTDIDGDTLTVRNDIGADEYVAAGGARRRIMVIE